MVRSHDYFQHVIQLFGEISRQPLQGYLAPGFFSTGNYYRGKPYQEHALHQAYTIRYGRIFSQKLWTVVDVPPGGIIVVDPSTSFRVVCQYPVHIEYDPNS